MVHTPVIKHPACFQTADFHIMTAHGVKSGVTSTHSTNLVSNSYHRSLHRNTWCAEDWTRNEMVTLGQYVR